MPKINPYNPLDLEALGDSLLRELERRPVEPLATVERFPGSGIYALYYAGSTDPYEAMGGLNAKRNCVLPIYVGRAKDTGARQGLNPFEPVTKSLLWERIKHHRGTIAGTASLKLEDFMVRALVVMPIWIPLAEAMAIRRYQPLWNSQLQGFGIHAPGGGRARQRRSEWDELHRGRGFARKLRPNARTQAALLERMRQAAQSATNARVQQLDSALSPADIPVPSAPQLARVTPARRSRSAASPRPKRP